MAFLLKSNLHLDRPHFLEQSLNDRFSGLGKGSVCGRGGQWLSLSGMVKCHPLCQEHFPLRGSPHVLHLHWVSVRARPEHALLMSQPLSDCHTQENCFWARSQSRGLAEQPSQEVQEGIRALFKGQTRLDLEWNTRTGSRGVHIQHMLIANCPEARESSEGTVFKSLWTRTEPGGDYEGGETMPGDQQCQGRGKLRVRLVQDQGIYLYGLL